MNINDFIKCISYNAKTGEFIWLKDKGRVKKGDLAGGKNGFGYIYISLNNNYVAAHRLAYAYVHGHFPKGVIDHINKNPSDNRIENLRHVTKVENGMNRKISSNNKSGFTGVSWCKTHKKWIAQISDNKKRILIGSFSSKESAIAAREQKEIELGYL